MTVARKIQGFMTAGSFIRKMFEDGVRLKKEYGAENVFDFSLGNPNLEPPEDFRKRLRDVALSEGSGMHKYMQNAGYPEARAAVAKGLNSAQGVNLSEDEIIMTCGAGGALNVILKTILDPGDEVISPAPFFVEYRFYVDNAGGALRAVPTRDDFSLDIDAIRAAINEKTRAILLNSPNNPTGKIYDEASIRMLAEILNQSKVKYNREIFLIFGRALPGDSL